MVRQVRDGTGGVSNDEGSFSLVRAARSRGVLSAADVSGRYDDDGPGAGHGPPRVSFGAQQGA